MKPGSGRAQQERLLDTLLDASVVFTFVNRDLELIPPRILPPQALVLALSPMLDARFVRAAIDLAARGFDLVVIAVSPAGPALAAVAGGAVADLAARLWALERRAQIDEHRRRGLVIVEWDGVEPLDAALATLRRPRLRRVFAGCCASRGGRPAGARRRLPADRAARGRRWPGSPRPPWPSAAPASSPCP